MSRLSDIIPSLYYGSENNLINFINALDVEVSSFEKQVQGITDLINVDKCPDDKLPYLAAFINCPLVGSDPIFWRRQIKNWPYILKFKGTEKSLELVLNSIDAASWNIKTYFRDSKNRYVTEKPEGQPFKDGNGIWRNIRTHYFGIDLILSKSYVQKKNYAWDDDEFREKLSFWLGRGKPYHSELLHFNIFPPDPLPDGHICYWDKCIWGHPEIELHDWGLLPLPVFENAPMSGIDFVHSFNTISDTQFLDMSTWGRTPYRNLNFGQDFEHGILVGLDRESTATWFIPYSWGNFTWDDSERYSRDFELLLQRGINVNSGITLQPSYFAYFLNSYADLSPYEKIQFGRNFQRDIYVNLNRESTATWFIPYSWGDFTWDDSERYSRDFELLFQRDTGINAYIKPQPFGRVYIINMLASLQPYWDFYTWDQHDTWGDDLGVPYFAPGFQRDSKASTQWSKEEAPDATWSEYRTWGDASWEKEPTCAGTCETGTWIDLEEATA